MVLRQATSNEKGAVKWDKDTKDAILLRHLIEEGIIEGMKPKQVLASYADFQKYQYPTFQSAINNMRRTYKNGVKRRSLNDDGNVTSNPIFSLVKDDYILCCIVLLFILYFILFQRYSTQDKSQWR